MSVLVNLFKSYCHLGTKLCIAVLVYLSAVSYCAVCPVICDCRLCLC